MEHEELLLLSNMFERTFDLVCIVDRKGWFKHVNPAVIKTLGYSREELFSKPVAARIHPDDTALTRAVREKLLNNEPLVNFKKPVCCERWQSSVVAVDLCLYSGEGSGVCHSKGYYCAAECGD